MRKVAFVVFTAVLAAGVVYLSSCAGEAPPAGQDAAQSGSSAPGGGPGGGGTGGNPSGRGFRPPMTLNTAQVGRSSLAEYVTVVGNLIGAATVEVVPKVNGRIESIAVRLPPPRRFALAG